MKKIKTTILLLILIIFVISLLNFSSATGTCQGDDVITQCSLVNCNDLYIIDNNGNCVDKINLAISAPPYCVSDNNQMFPICQNSYTQPTAQPTNNICPTGYEPSQTTSCSTYQQTNCDAQYPCSWTQTNEISCSKQGSTTTLLNTINTQNNQVQTDSCQLNTEYIYSCSQDQKSITTNTKACDYGCENSKCKTIESYSCSDTDQKSTTTKSTTTVTIIYSDNSQSTISSTDTCLNEQVKEYYCPTTQTSSLPQSEQISCNQGYSCSNGKCISNTISVKSEECTDTLMGAQITTTYSDNSKDTQSNYNSCNTTTQLTTYSCVNNKVSKKNIDCESSCLNAICQTSTSYWANKNTNIELTSKQVVTENSPKEIKLIIKNIKSTKKTTFKIFEKLTNTLIAEVVGVKIDNSVVATYNFTTKILKKLNKNDGEFTFYFTSNTVKTKNPNLKLLIQKEELFCPTKNTNNYNNGVCDNTETGFLCPLDCFTVGDGVCDSNLNENIFSSFFDCGSKNGLSVGWADKGNNIIEFTNITKVDINKIGKISFTMVAENSNLDNSLNFQLIGIKNLAEFPMKNFTGTKNKNTVSYTWTPTYEDFKKLKEMGGQTKFVFIFRINNIISSPLKIDLSSDVFPTCNDKEKNGDEEGVDCGGSCNLSCEELSFCEENMIISCSAYTNSGENYCEENPCNLYINSNSSCYWDTNKCEKKTVGETGICYYSENIEKLDTCEDGYLIYNYNSNFIFNKGIENKTSEDYINCVPESIPIACNLPSKKNKGTFSNVLGDLSKKSTNDKLKIAFLGLIALSFIYFSIKTFRGEKSITPQERIKKEFIKSKTEKKEKKENEIKTKSKKEIDAEELMKDFEMGLE